MSDVDSISMQSHNEKMSDYYDYDYCYCLEKKDSYHQTFHLSVKRYHRSIDQSERERERAGESRNGSTEEERQTVKNAIQSFEKIDWCM